MNVGVFATVQIVGELTLDFFPKRFCDATRQALLQPFSLEHCGVIKVKGKCEMSTWFLNKSDQN